jgi:uncharacterized damage-inducible protein DinB
MDFLKSALFGLQRSRWLGEQILSVFKQPSDWVHQVCPGANHALWVAGHLGLADNRFASVFRPELDRKPSGYEDRFWFGSTPSPDVGYYPPVEEVLAYYRERRETLLKLIPELTDADLNKPAPPPTAQSSIAGAQGMGQILLFAPSHELMHMGQVTLARKALGYPPALEFPKRG